MTSKHERRRHARVEAGFLAEWEVNGTFVPSEVVEISPFGIFMKTSRTAGPGQLIQLCLHIPDSGTAIECYGWVKHCGTSEQPGLGIELFAMWEKDRERWNAYYISCFKTERGLPRGLTLRPRDGRKVDRSRPISR